MVNYCDIILNHIYRYRITTLSVINILLFPDKSKEEIREICNSLINQKFIGVAQLNPYENYYYLTSKVAKERYNNKSKKASEFLEVHQLVEAYAMLAFCCLQNVKREKLPEHELIEIAKELTIKNIPKKIDTDTDKIPSNNYFKDKDNGKNVIGWLKVDFGFNHERVAQRIYPIIKKRFNNKYWQRLIIEGSFIITIATGWKTKAHRLRENINDNLKFKQKICKYIKNDFNYSFQKNESFPIKVNVCEIPELKSLNTKL